MVELPQVLPFLVYSILAGLVGTAGMTLLLYVITKSGIANARMVFAVGSLFTRSTESALLVGSTLHVISGVIFGMLYTLVFEIMAPMTAERVIQVGLFLGFCHGILICFGLVAAIAEEHPLEEFREAGFSVGVAHLLAHLAYGLLVGLVIAISGIVAHEAAFA